MSPLEKQITKLYVGLFNRAPDPDGFNFWMGQAAAGGKILDIANSFALSPEFASIYGGLGYSALIDRIYGNLFHRVPDADGKAYWLAQLESGGTPGALITNVMSGALGADRIMLENAANVANAWMSRTPGPFDMAAAHEAIASINEHQPVTGNGIDVRITSPELLPYQNEIVATIKYAWHLWEIHFDNISQIQVDVGYVPIPGTPATGELYASAAALMEVITAGGYTQSGVAQEIITGMDPNGSMPDAFINIHMEPGRLFSTFPVTAIFAHEVGHILVNRSANGNLNADGPTSYDRWITANNGTVAFAGPETMATFGGPMPIHRLGSFINWAHFGNEASLMYPYIEQYDFKTVGVIETATLRDIGIAVT